MQNGFYQSVLTNNCECDVYFENRDGVCKCPYEKDPERPDLCFKKGCTFSNSYLDEMPKNFDPAKKDDVIAQLISIYGWGNNESFIQNLTTTFVNLMVQYPECIPLLAGIITENQSCSDNQYSTLSSFHGGISKYRCNFDPPSEALSSETPPSEATPTESPQIETPPSEVPENEAPPGELPHS